VLLSKCPDYFPNPVSLQKQDSYQQASVLLIQERDPYGLALLLRAGIGPGV